MARPEQRPQVLTEQQQQTLIETLRAIGVRPRFINQLENQKQILFTDAAHLITLAARAHFDLAPIHDSTWEKIIQNLKQPAAPLMKDSRGRGG